MSYTNAVAPMRGATFMEATTKTTPRKPPNHPQYGVLSRAIEKESPGANKILIIKILTVLTHDVMVASFSAPDIIGKSAVETRVGYQHRATD